MASNVADGNAIRGFSTQRAAEIAGITYRQIDYWARTDLLRPSLVKAAGSGSRRLYSYGDVLELKVIKRLLDAGIELNKVRVIFDYVRTELGEDISAATLVLDGANSAVVRTQDELIDALQRGQGVLPLSNLQQEVDAAIVDLFRSSEIDEADEADDFDDEEDDGGGFQAAGGGR